MVRNIIFAILCVSVNNFSVGHTERKHGLNLFTPKLFHIPKITSFK